MILRRKNTKHIIVGRYDEANATPYQRAAHARVSELTDDQLRLRLRDFGYLPRRDMARETLIDAVLSDEGSL